MSKMKLGQLLRPAPTMGPDELRRFGQERAAGTWTLLDVRQPGEYQERHLAGAVLIPLPELKERLKELEPGKPLVAYCAVGGRSRAAAQFLQGQGFSEVYNLKGGIKAWDGQVAVGPESWGLELAEPGEGPAQALAAAFGLERGLRAVYQALAAQAGQGELAALYTRLAGFEDKHMDRLRRALDELEPSLRQGVELGQDGSAPRMEGGWEVDDFVAQQREGISDPASAVMLAMGLETQAMDLYLRLAERMEQQASKEVFWDLGDEELGHLKYLAQELDNLPAS